MRFSLKKILGASLFCSLLLSSSTVSSQEYKPTESNLKARKEFSDAKFGIFLHWGIYSMYAQGEWYLHFGGLNKDDYSQAASGFYPSKFNALDWVKAIKASGAKYICFTSRHHDGFSMFATKQSDYNIVDATPFKRDIFKELADACHKEGIKLFVYYSHLDWMREDYPIGDTGRKTGRTGKSDWKSYYNFMNAQLTEILSNYGKIDGIWFDGCWDRKIKDFNTDWELEKQYKLIHSLQDACLIGNNHHRAPFLGEDFQMFERDLPGENKSGFSGSTTIGKLPLETCETMSSSWGYKVTDTNFKSAKEIVHLLARSSGKGANLLLNVGPQSNGELPAKALARFKEVGAWMNKYGSTIYGTTATNIPSDKWGTTTRKDNKIYVHVLNLDTLSLTLPLKEKVKSAVVFGTKNKVEFKQSKGTLFLKFANKPTDWDYIIELTMPKGKN